MTEPRPTMNDAGPILSVVSTLLDTIDWDQLADDISTAEAIGPFIDPTSFGRALDDRTLEHNRKIVNATRDYLAVLHQVHTEANS